MILQMTRRPNDLLVMLIASINAHLSIPGHYVILQNDWDLVHCKMDIATRFVIKLQSEIFFTKRVECPITVGNDHWNPFCSKVANCNKLCVWCLTCPWGSGGVYRMVGLRRPSTFLKDFFSETTKPIPINFHMQLPKNGGTKVCSNGPGHMTKMAAKLKYRKSLKIFFRTTGPIVL